MWVKTPYRSCIRWDNVHVQTKEKLLSQFGHYSNGIVLKWKAKNKKKMNNPQTEVSLCWYWKTICFLMNQTIWFILRNKAWSSRWVQITSSILLLGWEWNSVNEPCVELECDTATMQKTNLKMDAKYKNLQKKISCADSNFLPPLRWNLCFWPCR